MKNVAFLGAYDKIDCILYVAKILRTLGKSVIVIDATDMQKAKYIVPVINPTTSYVTEFEEIDVSVGFEDFVSIKRYLGVPDDKELEYDFALINIDKAELLEKFGINQNTKSYFVTSFDLYSLKRGLEIISNVKEPMNLTKILFSKEMSKEEDDYLNFLSLDYKVVWGEYRIYFPIENGDASVIADNQRVAKIKFKQLSAGYKDSLMYISEELLKDVSSNEIRRAVKIIEKGV